MDALGMSSTLNRNNLETNVLNSPAQIIIKKENIGLHEYQHQHYQYSLFNNNEKRDKFHEELTKIKDRLERGAPNMQQVINMDMKRAEVNKVYERKLRREMNGSGGLNWQYKHEIQRLENDEREAERDLRRLNRDRARASRSSLSRQPASIHSGSVIEATSRSSPTKMSPRRSLSINIQRISDDSSHAKRISTPFFYERFPRRWEEIHPQSNEIHPHLRKHANSLNRQKREIEQKLKEFLH